MASAGCGGHSFKTSLIITLLQIDILKIPYCASMLRIATRKVAQ